MMLQITEEQSVNSAMMVCTSGLSSAVKFAAWIKRQNEKKVSEAARATTAAEQAATREKYADACSAYRGGYVKNPEDPGISNFITDLGGSDKTVDERTFQFLGNKSDLSYFWKKVDAENHITLLREYVDAIPDQELHQKVASTLTQAREQGLLSYDGNAYALTDKGKDTIYNLQFISKRVQDEASAEDKLASHERYADACSAYRGGYVKNPTDPEISAFITDLGGTDMPASDRTFLFHGNKTDLSYFWKKVDAENHTILLREYVDSIPDPEVHKKVVSSLTQAREQGLLSYDGTAYALTDKGKDTIYNLQFISNRVQAEEKYFSKLKLTLEEAGIKGVSRGDKYYVFVKPNQKPVEMVVVNGTVDDLGTGWIKFSSDQGNVVCQQDCIGKIAFTDIEQGEAYVAQNPGEVEMLQASIRSQLNEINQEIQREKKMKHTSKDYTLSYTNEWEKNDNDFTVKVAGSSQAQSECEQIHIPQTDVKVEGDTIHATIYKNRDYMVTDGANAHPRMVDGDGIRMMLENGAIESQVSQTTNAAGEMEEVSAAFAGTTTAAAEGAAQAASAVTTTAAAVGEAAVAAVDTAATVFPPAKAVTATVQILYKVAQASTQASQGASSGLTAKL